MKISTGSYDNCKYGNLISISGDLGKSIGFKGNYYSKLAPKLSFWKDWHKNIGFLSDEENNRFYMEKYYEMVLRNLDANEVLNDLLKFGDDIILLCYEKVGEFCHRHLVAAWLELELGIIVNEVIILFNNQISVLNESNNLKKEFKKLIKSYKN